jgi:tagatose-1,6-bisphosphate aldolase non-catalytic subunit AgaZ/GatZ
MTGSSQGNTRSLLGRAGGPSRVRNIVDLLRGPLGDSRQPGGRHTLLAVCPISKPIAQAALRAAQEANAPLLYAATLNQVDRDGGYTDWTPSSFAAFVEQETERLEIDIPVILGLDHGGPWKKDAHVLQNLSYSETLAAVKRSLVACIEAGYELLHLDPTVDRRLPPHTPVPVDDIVTRTVELLAFAEATRRDLGRDPIAYEVGTEEVGGGLQSEERFRTFLNRLDEALQSHSLPAPCFVVGDVGTTLDTAHFNRVRARRLTAEAEANLGALLKGHYTDAVADLSAYPLSGMGGANVGPGLSATKVRALQDLVQLEQNLDADSHFSEALRTAVVNSDRWRKWLRPAEEGLPFDALSPDRQDWLIETGSRYVWSHPDVQAARDTLYEHVAPYRDARAFVRWRIKTDVLRYVHAFNLIDFHDRLEEALANQ